MKTFVSYLPIALVTYVILFNISCNTANSADNEKSNALINKSIKTKDSTNTAKEKLDTSVYNEKLLALANNDTTGRWPAKFPYPLPGAILPFNRIVASMVIYIQKKWVSLANCQKMRCLRN